MRMKRKKVVKVSPGIIAVVFAINTLWVGYLLTIDLAEPKYIVHLGSVTFLTYYYIAKALWGKN